MDEHQPPGKQWTEETIVYFASSLDRHYWQSHRSDFLKAKQAHSFFDSWFKRRNNIKDKEICYYGLKVWLYSYYWDEQHQSFIDIHAGSRSMSSQLVTLAVRIGGIEAANAFQAFIEGGGKPYVITNSQGRPRRRDLLLDLIRGSKEPSVFHEIRQDERPFRRL